jgi:ribose transport system substrate-binding protein
MKKFLIVLMGLLLFGGLAFAGGRKDAAGSGGYKFGFAATTMNNPFFHTIEDAIREEVQKRGDTLIVVDAQNDAQKQLALVEDLIAQDIDVMFLCPVNSAGIKSALQACQRAGIPIVNFDTDVIDTDLVASIIVSDNYYAGVLVAQDMMSKLPRNSKVSILTSPSAEACVKRVNGFKDTAQGYFTIVSELDGKGDTAVSLGIAEDILQGNPDLAAFYAINDPSALGCIQAIRSQRRGGDILVYGVDGQPDGKKAVLEGSMEATAAQSPINIGKQTIETAYKILDGETVKKDIDVPVFLITKNNVSQYGVDGWQ